jgi:hypothetical protein
MGDSEMTQDMQEFSNYTSARSSNEPQNYDDFSDEDRDIPEKNRAGTVSIYSGFPKTLTQISGM